MNLHDIIPSTQLQLLEYLRKRFPKTDGYEWYWDDTPTYRYRGGSPNKLADYQTKSFAKQARIKL